MLSSGRPKSTCTRSSPSMVIDRNSFPDWPPRIVMEESSDADALGEGVVAAASGVSLVLVSAAMPLLGAASAWPIHSAAATTIQTRPIPRSVDLIARLLYP